MNPTVFPAPVRCRAALLFLSLGTALAQSVPPPTATPTDSVEAKEPALELSPFQVSAAATTGYVASESMTGSRVATKIIDLPYTVNVLTSEFFEDFALFELADNIVQIGGFTGLDVGGGFTLRGFGSTSQLRDGFFRLGRYGSSNVDRMEIIKGSNAAIYGRSSPGGMINMISKQPKDREYYKLSLNYGDYRTRRATFEATGPLYQGRLGRTTYVFTGSHYEKGFDIEFARNRNKEYYLAVKHVFPDGASLFLSAESFLQIRHAPNSSAPLIIDQKGTASNLDDRAIGYAKNLAEFNAFGPNSELNRGNTGFNAIYEKQLNEVFNLRVAGNYYRARRWDYNQNTGFGAITVNAANGAAPASARGATPNKGLIFEDGGGFQTDLLAHYWTNGRQVEHRTLLTVDFNDYYRWDPTNNFAAASNPTLVAWNAVRTLRLNPDFTPVAPVDQIAYFPSSFVWGQQVRTRFTKRRTTALGGVFRQQSAFLNGTLLTYAGARFDALRFQDRDFQTAATSFPDIPNYKIGQMIRRVVTEFKPNAGVNYRLPGGLRAFVNYSESYFVNQTDNPNVIADANYASESATGWDYGFKGSYLEDRLNFTLSGFSAQRHNVRVTEIVEFPLGSGNFVNDTRPDGDQRVRGFEADLNWRVNDAVTTGLSLGHVDSVFTDFGSAFPLSVGRQVNNVAPYNGSIYVKYAGTGRLKGFSANANVTYVDRTHTESPNAGDTYTTTATGERVLLRSTEQWKLTVPSATLVNIGVRYTLHSGRWDHTLALNVNNVFDRDYLKINRQLGERRAFFATYTVGLAGKAR